VTGATPTVRDGEAEKRDSILDVAAGAPGSKRRTGTDSLEQTWRPPS